MSNREESRKGSIFIDDKYAILTMPINYALARIRYTKKGERYIEPFAYYASVHQCLMEYAKQTVHDALDVETDISLREALKLAQEAVERSEEAIRASCPWIQIDDGDNTQRELV